jgi:hypothetical protein
MRGKMSKLPFPKKAEKEKGVLDCIVSDVCGPMQTETTGKSRYLITFTDVCSAFTETEFMRTKDETAEKTIEFLEKVKNQFNRKVKKLRTDRGTEYLCSRLQDYLRKEGIITQCTVAGNPQQNGKSERVNRTLMEGARTLLISSGLPNKYWAEAVHNVNETFNMLPKDSNSPSPYEVFHGKAPNFDFHEFGCQIYVKIPDEKRRKLDEKAEEMQYLGLDKRSKGYRVLDSKGSIKIVRDVKFVEEKLVKQQVTVVENESDIDDEIESDDNKQRSDSSDNDFPDMSQMNLNEEPSNETIEVPPTPFLETEKSQRQKRVTKRPERFGEVVNSSVIEHEKEPTSYKEAKVRALWLAPLSFSWILSCIQVKLDASHIILKKCIVSQHISHQFS